LGVTLLNCTNISVSAGPGVYFYRQSYKCLNELLASIIGFRTQSSFKTLFDPIDISAMF